MNSKLARVLIAKNIIQRGSLFEAYYNVKGISGQCNAEVLGNFKLIGAQAVGEWIYFETLGENNTQHRIRCDSVVSLDGMPLERVAESQQLTLEGEDATSNSRRGRRKKLEEVEMC